MIKTSIDNLARVLGADCSPAAPGSAGICGVSIDSRQVSAGQAFFAIRGERFDGHDFAAEVVRKGAACVIVERAVSMPSDNAAPVLKVRDTTAALAALAHWYRGQLSAAVVAITGSAGKTTVRSMLHHVLSGSFRCHQAVKSFNNQFGVPLTILDAPADCQILLAELGTNHPGEIEALARIVNPDAGCITLIGPAHLEGFGSLENILKEKASIAKGLKPGGTLYVNGDQSELAAVVKTLGCRVVTFGTTDTCDVIGTNLETNGLSGALTLEGKRIAVPLPGRANLMNVLTVWSICRDLKVALSDFAERVMTISSIPMRLAVEAIGRATLLNDCYNANPASMANALDALSHLAHHTKQRAIFLAGSMGELGPTAADLHRELGRQAAEANVGCLLACGPFADRIVEGATAAGLDPAACEIFETTAALCDKLYSFVRPADIILVKGSRAAGLEAAVETLRAVLRNNENNKR